MFMGESKLKKLLQWKASARPLLKCHIVKAPSSALKENSLPRGAIVAATDLGNIEGMRRSGF